jgi:hypothetical protein
MVLSDPNALNFKRGNFCVPQSTVPPIRQKFALLNLKENFDDPRFARFQRLSVSIGRFLPVSARIVTQLQSKKDRQRWGKAHLDEKSAIGYLTACSCPMPPHINRRPIWDFRKP